MLSHLARSLATVAFAPLLLAATLGAQKTTPTQVPEYTIEEFLATTEIFGSSFSPDNRKILVSTNQTGVYNAYAIPVGGGAPTQLTRSTTDAVFARSYFPRDERFLYESDKGGNELSHLYVRGLDGSSRDLTPGKKLKASFAGWAHDKRSFFVITNERDAKFFDVYEITTNGYKRTMLYRNDSGFDFGAISRDKRWIALVKPRTTNDSDIHLYDTRTKTLKNITAHSGNVNSSPAEFTPDGRALYFITDAGSEFAHLVQYDLASGKQTTILEPEWDVMYASFSESGKYLVAGINNDARTEIKVFEAATMQPVSLPAMPAGSITQVRFAPDDSRIALYASDSRSPRDLFVAELGKGEARRLTRALNPKIDPAHLADARVQRFASYDSLKIPGLLYIPHRASREAKTPALVMVHGGPGGQARLGYDALAQYLVNHGYVVYDINNRGSSGYGKSFYAMDDLKHGEADLGDVVASKRMLIETGVVDPDRIGIIGGSYGGYMVLAALAFKPEEFAVGVDIFGVANWLRTLESIPAWWESFREALYAELGNPVADKERLRRISPLFHAKNITKPLIVLQGANDPRVLKVESDEIVAAVRSNGTPVEYVVFPDEGHGFNKKANEMKGYKAILDFLDVHLKRHKAM